MTDIRVDQHIPVVVSTVGGVDDRTDSPAQIARAEGGGPVIAVHGEAVQLETQSLVVPAVDFVELGFDPEGVVWGQGRERARHGGWGVAWVAREQTVA